MRRLTPLLFVALACGCGGKKTIRVTGRVVFADGTPLKSGMVIFNPVDEADARPSSEGVIQEDGSFKLRTYGNNDGALAGRYRVAIQVPPAEDAPEDAPAVLDGKFSLSGTSGLEVEVGPDKANDFTFTVHPPKPPE